MGFEQGGQGSIERLEGYICIWGDERSFRREGHLVLYRQYFPFYASGIRSVSPAGTYAFSGGLPAYAGDRDGSYAGADYLDQARVHYLRAGGVCAGGRLDRPGT